MLHKLLTPDVASDKINYASLILRVPFGLMMMRYGLMKIENYSEWSTGFMDFLGLGGPVSLGLVIFAEFFCALLVVIGLGTRLALLPLMFTMLMAFFIAHADDPFDQKEHSLLFLFPYIAIMIIGAGRFSLDALVFKKTRSSDS